MGKFCKFCAEPHQRKQSTCSEACSTELIRTEFEENGDLERACLWCPVRGDLAPFKHHNCCNLCYVNRQTSGACAKCGGSMGSGDCCSRCTPTELALKLRPTHRAYILVDVDTNRARRFLSSVNVGTKSHRDWVGVVKVGRVRFERVKASEWPAPVAYVASTALDVGGASLLSRVEKLKLFRDAGPRFTRGEWTRRQMHASGTTQSASDRYFERAKVEVKSWGVGIALERDLQESFYKPDQEAVSGLLLYYKTIIKNKKMGYYW